MSARLVTDDINLEVEAADYQVSIECTFEEAQEFAQDVLFIDEGGLDEILVSLKDL
jgi:hypothetical protein